MNIIRTGIPTLLAAAAALFPKAALAAEAAQDFTSHWTGIAAIVLFLVAYILVILEESLDLKKSKPVMIFGGLIWILVAFAYREAGLHNVADLVRHNMLEFAELMLFLLAAMAYINTMEERNIFDALRAKLVSSGLSLRSIYWLTGLLAFFISPVADNLTTALVMGAVVLAIGQGRTSFIVVSCINVVVAANAGGAFSPFGDITTLMVWQKGVVAFTEFFALFFPSLISWIIPAAIMSFTVPKEVPPPSRQETKVKIGGIAVTALFILTIAGTVLLHHFLELPPFLGMMMGLGLLSGYGFFVRRVEMANWTPVPQPSDSLYKVARKPFDIFISVKRVEWDTLLFFYGIILCVGGLGALGYLALVSNYFYTGLGPMTANILVGVLSAIIDNIPVMFAVLSMNPEMSHGQWLLVTLTAGIGGSLLSIGSAAGVALMGQARGVYTFFAHLKWTWAIALGYLAGVWSHVLINAKLF